MKELPLALVTALVVLGLGLTTAFDRWRLGVGLVGLALCLGAVFRLTLPARQAGLLVVRSRTVDAVVLLSLGFGLVALANSIPASH